MFLCKAMKRSVVSIFVTEINMSITRQSDKVTCKVSSAGVVRLMDDYAVVLNIERAIRLLNKTLLAVCQDFMYINVVKTCRKVLELLSASGFLVSCFMFLQNVILHACSRLYI